ncbi:MAG: hypothetical protein KDI62_22260 [Anaerolineae bacterium]|nr:hypothetical protein [Anaerolineae bacterium]
MDSGLVTNQPTNQLTNHPTILQRGEVYVVSDSTDQIVRDHLSHHSSADGRRAAAQQGRPEFMSLWAGQGSPLGTGKPAAELVADIVAQAANIVR